MKSTKYKTIHKKRNESQSRFDASTLDLSSYKSSVEELRKLKRYNKSYSIQREESREDIFGDILRKRINPDNNDGLTLEGNRSQSPLTVSNVQSMIEAIKDIKELYENNNSSANTGHDWSSLAITFRKQPSMRLNPLPSEPITSPKLRKEVSFRNQRPNKDRAKSKLSPKHETDHRDSSFESTGYSSRNQGNSSYSMTHPSLTIITKSESKATMLSEKSSKDGNGGNSSAMGTPKASSSTKGGTGGRRIKLKRDTFYTTRVSTPYCLTRIANESLISRSSSLQESDEESLRSSKRLDRNHYLKIEELQRRHRAELEHFEEISAFAEARLSEVLSKEAASGRGPTNLKAIVCADLLRKVARILNRYSHILDPLIDQLLNCVFHDYFNLLELNQHRQVDMKDLYTAGTYFDKVDSLEGQLVESELELKMYTQGKDMEEELEKFKYVRSAFDGRMKLIRDACFKTWKKHHQLVQSTILKQRYKLMRSIIVRWRLYNALESRVIPEDLDFIGVNGAVLEEIINIRAEARERKIAMKKEKIASQVSVDLAESGSYDSDLAVPVMDDAEREELLKLKEKQLERLRTMNIPKVDCSTQTEDNWQDVIRQEILDEMEKKKIADEQMKEKLKEEASRGKLKQNQVIGPSKMANDTASELIALIYEAVTISYKQLSGTPFKTKSFSEHIKELFVRHFGVKRIAAANVKALTLCCAENHDNKRLGVFADVLGIPTKAFPNRRHSTERCTFFFKMLSLLFPQPQRVVSSVFMHKIESVDRSHAESVLREMFRGVEERAPETFQLVLLSYSELQFVSKPDPSGRFIQKVNIDEYLYLAMRFVRFEIPDDTSGAAEEVVVDWGEERERGMALRRSSMSSVFSETSEGNEAEP